MVRLGLFLAAQDGVNLALFHNSENEYCYASYVTLSKSQLVYLCKSSTRFSSPLKLLRDCSSTLNYANYVGVPPAVWKIIVEYLRDLYKQQRPA